MAVVAIGPNSVVWLFKGVPLDNTYTHTILFNTEYDQRNTFLNLLGSNNPNWLIATYTKQMYKRLMQNKIRVRDKVEKLYSCNYMAFINQNFVTSEYPEGKMFYAFVTGVEYVSDEVTEITYELDMMQTHMFDYQLTQCFVEREHTLTDELYEHTMPENLGLGEYCLSPDYFPNVTVGEDERQIDAFNELGFFVVSTSEPSYTGDSNKPNATGAPSYTIKKADPKVYGGLLCGTHTEAFYSHDNSDTTDAVLARVKQYLDAIDTAGYSDGVINIFCAPIAFWWEVAGGSIGDVVSYEIDLEVNNDWLLVRDSETGNLRQPKNKKCYSYPFAFLFCTSSDGDSFNYKYELSTHTKNEDEHGRRYFKLLVSGSINADAEFIIRPVSYRTDETVGRVNNEDVIRCTKTPLCSWNSDSFKCWLAQHKAGMIGGAVSTLVGVAGGLAMAGMGVGSQMASANPISTAQAGWKLGGSIIGAATDIVQQTANTIGAIGDASAQPNRPRGDVSGVMDIANHTFGFRVYNCFVKPEYLVTVDDYFTKFGYSVKTVKVPKRDNRPHYTYVKTLGCEIKPANTERSCNAADSALICSIYNHGITFWKNWNEVGDYTVDNSPAT